MPQNFEKRSPISLTLTVTYTLVPSNSANERNQTLIILISLLRYVRHMIPPLLHDFECEMPIFTAPRVCIARTMPWQNVCVCPSVTRRYSV